MARTAELFDGTTLEFEDGTPDDVIKKTARRETDRIRDEQARKPLPEGVKPSDAGGGRGSVNPEAPTEPRRSQPSGRGFARYKPEPQAGSLNLKPGETVADRAAGPGGAAYPDTPLEAVAGATLRPGTEGPVRERAMAEGRMYSGPRSEMTEAPMESKTASALRRFDRKPLDNSLGGAALEVVGDAARGVAKIPLALATAGYGALQAGADVFGAEDLARFGAAASKFGRGQLAQFDNPNGDKLVTGAFQSLGSAALGGAVGGAAGAVGLAVGQTAGDKYSELRARDIPIADALEGAAVHGVAEYLGERIGMKSLGRMVSGLAEKTGMRPAEILKEALKQQGEEQVTLAIQSAYDKLGSGSLRNDMTWDQYLDDVLDTAAQTAIMTAAAGGGGALARAAGGKKESLQASPYELAKSKGFFVDAPLKTDPPTKQRSKTTAVFDNLVALHGIDEDAAKQARDLAAKMPLAQVGGFYAKFVGALQKRGLAPADIDPDVLATVSAGPIDDPELAKPEPKVTKPAAAPAAAPQTTDETAEEDLSGLSEPAAIDDAAHAAATSPKNELPEPTAAQALAGNYAKGHAKIGGLDVSIENPEGSTRRDKNNDPPKWETVMRHHYGYLRGTVGQDGEHIDTFIKPGTADAYDGNVFVIDQVNKDGTQDEHKVMLGFDTQAEAEKAYLSNYEKGWTGMGTVTPTTMADFKGWLKDGDTTKPFGKTPNEPAQPDVAVPAQPPAEPAAGGRAEPSGSGRTVGRNADDAGRPVPAAARAPAPSLPAPAPVGTRGKQPAAVARVIARAGTTPNTAQPIELRDNPDGTSTPWHEGYEMLDHESGDPIKVPASATPREALDAIKQAGALGRRMKLFADKAEADTAEKPAAAADALAAASNEPTNSLAKTASWVIKEKGTGRVVMETFDRKKVDALNTAKYEAVPIAEHLGDINKSIRKAELDRSAEPVDPVDERTAEGTDIKGEVSNPDNAIDPLTPAIITKLKDGPAAVEWLVASAKDTAHRDIAQRLRPFIGPSVSLRFVGTGDAVPAPVANRLSNTAAAVAQQRSDGNVIIWMHTGRSINETLLLHELIHSATMRALAGTKNAILRAEMQNTLAAVRRSFTDAENTERLAMDQRQDAAFFSRVLTDEDELMAYAFSSPSMRRWMQNMNAEGKFIPFEKTEEAVRARAERAEGPEPGPLTMWQKFVDLVRQLLRIGKRHEPALQQMLADREARIAGVIKAGMDTKLYDRLDGYLDRALKAQAADTGPTAGAVASGSDKTSTDAFKRWFSDSKVVDEAGKPAVVFHGTGAADLTKFDLSRIGQNGRAEGAGIYFTTEREIAEGYGQRGKVVEAYLSIRQPLDYKAKPFNQQQVRKFLAAVAAIEARENGRDWQDGFLSNFVDTYSTGLDVALREASKTFNGEELALDQVSGLIGAGVDPEIVNEGLTTALGFDGYRSEGFSGEGGKAGTIWVAMRSQQVKSATDNSGAFDPNDPDIRADFSGSQIPTGEAIESSPVDADNAAALAKIQGEYRRKVKAFQSLTLTALPDAPRPAAGDTPLRQERYAAAQIARHVFGNKVVFFSSNLDQFANGLMVSYSPNTVFVNESTTRPVMAVVGHELTHSMRQENPVLYGKLADRLRSLLNEPGEYHEQLAAKYRARGIPTLSFDKLREELVADIVGDNFTDPMFWRAMAHGQPTLFQRVLKAVREFLDGVLGKLKNERPYATSRYLTDVQAARDVVASVMRDFAASRQADASNASEKPEVDGAALSEGSEPFYSELARQAERAAMKQAPADGWLQWLKGLTSKGVKADEIAWTGIEDWLRMQDGKVTPEAVLEYLQGNGVKVREVVLDENDGLSSDERAELNELRDLRRRHEGGERGVLEPADVRRLRELEHRSTRTAESTPKYGQYTLPGGRNYQELLLTLPTSGLEPTPDPELRKNTNGKWAWFDGDSQITGAFIEREDAVHHRPSSFTMTERHTPGYKSSHWDQPNILAHIRFNERTDAEGKRVLFVEEVQSDWAQEGKKKGFINQGAPWEVFDPKDAATVISRHKTEAEAKAAAEASGTFLDYANALTDRSRVPTAPFVGKTDAWVSLAVKRVIKYAVDNGFDRVAFVNGEQSADRYGLSKEISRIDYDEGTKNLLAFNTAGKVVINRTAAPEELPDLIGKEVADRLLKADGGNTGFQHTLQGLDLKVGGEGMKAFYDKIVPSVVKDVLRKVGGEGIAAVDIGATSGENDLKFGMGAFEASNARVVERAPNVFQVWVKNANGIEQVRGGNHATMAAADAYIASMQPGTKQLGFDITPEMREKAAGGLPMFSLPDYTPEQRDALARAGIDTRSRLARAGERIRANYTKAMGALRSDWGKQFRQGALDQFTGIATAVQRDVGNLPVEQDPYVAVRLANGGTSSVMRGLLLHGQARWAANGQHLEKIPGTLGLLDILRPLGTDLDAFFGWMIGQRAKRLKTEGRERNFTDEQIDALLTLSKGKEAEFRRAALGYTAFKRSVLDIGEGGGVINPESRKVWDQADHIPFYRKTDEAGMFTATGKKGLAGQSSGIRTLKGGEAALNDPMENLLMNFSRLIDASLKNNALRKTINVLQGAGSDAIEQVGYDMARQMVPADQVKKRLVEAGTPQMMLDVIPPEAFEGMARMWAIQAPTDPDVIRVMVDGKPKFYRVNDPLLLKAATSFVPFDFPGLGVMRAFKRVLTAAVTATPEFMARNFIRDSMAVHLVGRDGFQPGKSMSGIVKSYAEAGGFEDMLFAGASFQSGQVNASDPTGTAVAMRRALRKKGFNASSANEFIASVVDTPAKFWEKYRRAGEAIENANREAIYEATLKAGKGKTAAAYEAKDIMDFTLRGSSPLYQVAADVLPFFNARVQGLYRVGRANPKRLATYGALMLVGAVALAMINADNDEYDALPDWDKDTYWHFWVQGQHFRIPKPFELGVAFGTIPERIVRYIKGQDSGKKLAGRLWSNIRDQLAFDPVPQMIRPGLDAYMNKDSFRDRPIEGMADEGKLPSMRYGASTSSTAKAAVDAANMRIPFSNDRAMDTLGLSPKKVEFLVGGYLGTAGLYALGVSDMAFNKLQGKPPGPAKRLDELPLIRSFYQQAPAKSTVFESDLYNLRNEVEQVYRSVNALAREGQADEAIALADENADKLAVRSGVNTSAGMLAKINKQRDAIFRNTTMTPAQKRVEIDKLYVLKAQVARETMKQPAVRAAQ